MILTNHSIDRGSERLGLDTGAFVRMAAKALKCGIRHGDTNGQLKKYLDRLYLSQKNADNMRIYGEFVYLFRGELLLTVMHLPNEFKKIVTKIKNRTNEKD